MNSALQSNPIRRGLNIFAFFVLTSALLNAGERLWADMAAGGDPNQYRPATLKDAKAQLGFFQKPGVTQRGVMNEAVVVHPVDLIPVEPGQPANLPEGVFPDARPTVPPVADPGQPMNLPASVEPPDPRARLEITEVASDAPLPQAHIVILDEGYGLTNADRRRIRQYLQVLPYEDTYWIKKVVVHSLSDLASMNSKERVQLIDGVLHIFEDPKAKDSKATLIHQLAIGVGLNVSRNWPPNDNEWHTVSGGETLRGFAEAYARFTEGGSKAYFREALKDPTGVRLSAALYVASWFVQPGQKYMSIYTNAGNGEISQVRATARRTQDWMVMGGFSFQIQNGKLTSWLAGNVFTKYPAPKKGEPPKTIVSNAIKNPIDLHYTVKERVYNSGPATSTATPMQKWKPE